MNSEKVKEIKKALEQDIENGIAYYNEERELKYIDYREILTLINELESENERWQEKEGALSCDLDLLSEKLTNAEIEVDDYKDRIALLEKDNELLRNAKVVYETVDYCYEDLKKAEKRIAELEKENTRLANRITCKVVLPDEKLQEIKKECFKKIELAKGELLKQFAEMLKEKGKSTYDFFQCPTKENRVISISDINETLKEFISE